MTHYKAYFGSKHVCVFVFVTMNGGGGATEFPSGSTTDYSIFRKPLACLGLCRLHIYLWVVRLSILNQMQWHCTICSLPPATLHIYSEYFEGSTIWNVMYSGLKTDLNSNQFNTLMKDVVFGNLLCLHVKLVNYAIFFYEIFKVFGGGSKIAHAKFHKYQLKIGENM